MNTLANNVRTIIIILIYGLFPNQKLYTCACDTYVRRSGYRCFFTNDRREAVKWLVYALQIYQKAYECCEHLILLIDSLKHQIKSTSEYNCVPLYFIRVGK